MGVRGGFGIQVVYTEEYIQLFLSIYVFVFQPIRVSVPLQLIYHMRYRAKGEVNEISITLTGKCTEKKPQA